MTILIEKATLIYTLYKMAKARNTSLKKLVAILKFDYENLIIIN